jgi:protein-S-isoprenylcysteine O-methyltransferase Ste14
MRWRRYARRAVSALFFVVAAWLYLGGEHLWSLLATIAGVVVVIWMETRAEERFVNRNANPS